MFLAQPEKNLTTHEITRAIDISASCWLSPRTEAAMLRNRRQVAPSFAIPAITMWSTRCRTAYTAPAACAAPPVRTALPAHTELADADARFLDVDGVRVHYKVWGTPAPVETFLCVHGFGASLFSFSLARHALFAARPAAALLAYDAVGFGLTSRPPARRLATYAPSFGARICHELLDETDEADVVLVGHSLGALACIRSLLTYPRRFRAVVLIAPALVPSSTMPRPARLFVRLLLRVLTWAGIALSILLGPLLLLIVRSVVRAPSFWRRGLSLARFDPSTVTRSVLHGYRSPLRARRWDKGILNFWRCMLAERARALRVGEDLVQKICELPALILPPVLIVHGDSDRLVPLSNSRKLVSVIPGAQLVVLPRCGHVPHEEVPQAFAEAIDAFLNALP